MRDPYKEEENIYMVYTDYSFRLYWPALTLHCSERKWHHWIMRRKDSPVWVSMRCVWKFVAEGEMPQSIDTWQKIWALDSAERIPDFENLY